MPKNFNGRNQLRGKVVRLIAAGFLVFTSTGSSREKSYAAVDMIKMKKANC